MKKIFYILSMFLLLFALTACGEIEDDSEDTGENSSVIIPGLIGSENDSPDQDVVTQEPDNTEDSTPVTQNSSLRIIGKITYDRVKVKSSGVGLDYNNIVQEPARQVVVKGIGESGEVVASTTTDDNGDYSLDNLPQDTNIKIRVYAQLKKSGVGGWDLQVVDNTNGFSVYSMEGSLVSTGTHSTRRNLNASSGWGGRSYNSERTAAPFAILSSIYTAMEKIISVDSSATFSELVVNWSKNNVGVGGAIEDGQIGTSFFDGKKDFYVVGDENSDTDEYDDHIIIHEWGHYFEATFSRADSIGGPHSNNERIDIRVAFGEGWGNAISAIATDDPIYYDSLGMRQGNGWSMDIEGETPSVPGWYSEASIQRILYDLYDSNSDGVDRVSLGFAPLYKVLIGAQKNTEAFTSIFSFIKEIKDENPTEEADIDAILSSENINSISDIYGDSFHNLYSDIEVGGEVEVCTSTEYGSAGRNKLNNHKYVRFTISDIGNYRISARQNNGSSADPYFTLFKTSLFEDLGPTIEEDGYGTTEERVYQLSTGKYILDIADFNGRSRSCFDISLNN